MRREHVAGRNAPQLAPGLQQQRALLIYIDKTPMQGARFEARPDWLAERESAFPPRLSHRGETLLLPSPRPDVEMAQKGV
jgi:hypothetical protein